VRGPGHGQGNRAQDETLTLAGRTPEPILQSPPAGRHPPSAAQGGTPIAGNPTRGAAGVDRRRAHCRFGLMLVLLGHAVDSRARTADEASGVNT
jgi:hypothetical protein